MLVFGVVEATDPQEPREVHRSGPKEQAVASVKLVFLHQVGCQ
ncbi:unnamed protein product, partial [Musa textilis]